MKWCIEYSVLCENVGTEGNDDCRVSADTDLDRDGAMENARDAGWLILSRKAYCPACAAKRKPAHKKNRKPR